MIATFAGADVERFRAAIARRLGLHFDEAKLGYLGEVLARRTDAAGAGAGPYLDRLEGAPLPAELRALAQELTVSETYFFRHIEQFRAFAEVALPGRVAARASLRRLSILSAGCASGEEAYSLAILARERRPDPTWEIAIRAVDVNPASLEKARQGRYSAWALRGTPPDYERCWFRAEGHEFVLDPAVRAAVRLEERNIAIDDAELWPAASYDVVFCRNVLMYITPEHAQALVGRIARALAPGGYLFLGHAETLRGLSVGFHLCHTHDTFYYQRKDALEDSQVENAALPALRVPAASAADPQWSATWIETVQRASDRIQALAHVPPHAAPYAAATGGADLPRGSRSLGDALELLQQERYSQALEAMRGLAPESARDPDALLLRAVLLAHSGESQLAAQVCEELLAIDDLNAGAHYVLALSREGAGDRSGAVDHYQVAAYLDPAFAMPRLHLGLIARRGGDHESARRELAQALMLLRQEDAPRLLLFGGGFGREALLALCRAELVWAGGKP